MEDESMYPVASGEDTSRPRGVIDRILAGMYAVSPVGAVGAAAKSLAGSAAEGRPDVEAAMQRTAAERTFPPPEKSDGGGSSMSYREALAANEASVPAGSAPATPPEAPKPASHPRPTGDGWVSPKGDPYSYKKEGENFIVFNSRTGQTATVRPGTKSRLDPSVDAYAEIAKVFPTEVPPTSEKPPEAPAEKPPEASSESPAEETDISSGDSEDEEDDEGTPDGTPEDENAPVRKMLGAMRAARKRTRAEKTTAKK